MIRLKEYEIDKKVKEMEALNTIIECLNASENKKLLEDLLKETKIFNRNSINKRIKEKYLAKLKKHLSNCNDKITNVHIYLSNSIYPSIEIKFYYDNTLYYFTLLTEYEDERVLDIPKKKNVKKFLNDVEKAKQLINELNKFNYDVLSLIE